MIKIIDTKTVSDFTVFTREDEKKNEQIEKIVEEIIENVKANGDKALFEYCEKFDKCKLDTLLVSEEEIEEAFSQTDEYFIETLRQARDNISDFHSKQVRNDFVFTKEDGIVLGQKITPVEKAGLYVPGGTAAYPSTVLMDAIPAKIAGVSEIVMVTPPSADGKINPAILTSAKIAGVTKIFKLGGAQAVAALAYGTESVPKVDKIVGPGNIFVATAKKQVYGKVSIDMIAGPSEILVISDPTCDPAMSQLTFFLRLNTTEWQVLFLSQQIWTLQRKLQTKLKDSSSFFPVKISQENQLTTTVKFSLLIQLKLL